MINIVRFPGRMTSRCFLWSPQVDKTPLTRLVGHQQLINHIAFSPDGRYFASASFDKKVKLWCGKTGRFLSTCTGHVSSMKSVNYIIVR